jgi:hypothetical protein
MRIRREVVESTILTLSGSRSRSRLVASAMLGLLCLGAEGRSAAQADESRAAAPASVIVHSKFGGQIFGFDIDQNGTEGVLSEAQTLSDGSVLAAVETFDQRTGKILKVIAQSKTQDDFLTLGVVGTSIGLVEREHVISLLNVARSFRVMNPLGANKFTGTWTPPLDKKHIINVVSRGQGTTNIAAFAEDVSSNFTPWVFSSNVAANTFGPVVKIADENFTSGATPGMGYDSTTNVLVMGHSILGNPFIPGVIGLADLSTGAFTTFPALGTGDVNGLAVDSEDGFVCTTTEIDFSVEFYDLSRQAGVIMTLPNAHNQIFSGADVEYDPLHKLFLVAQPVSSTTATGSTIYVYTAEAAFVKAINGLNFSNAFNVVPAHIALDPVHRRGFVDGPDAGVTEIQSFSY